jgi:hypothetical protein
VVVTAAVTLVLPRRAAASVTSVTADVSATAGAPGAVASVTAAGPDAVAGDGDRVQEPAVHAWVSD